MPLDADAVEAQEAYRKVVTYFGETSKTMPPETFFPMFDRFIKAYGKAETDLERHEHLSLVKDEATPCISPVHLPIRM